MKRPLAFSLLFVLAVACEPRPTDAPVRDSTARQAVRAVDSAYVRGWTANAPDAVMATLAPDATIVPGGMEPIVGDSAIRAYWWPGDGSETRVTDYRTIVEEVGVSGELAYLRGTGELEFDWRSDPSSAWEAYSSESVWMALLRRGADGRWRMTHRMWHALDR